ncbi:hypothetical protein ANCDUO_16947, partial [Ancylostoma duodenale]
EIQASWSEKLKELSKKYSSAIAKARPYYEAKVQVNAVISHGLPAKYQFGLVVNHAGTLALVFMGPRKMQMIKNENFVMNHKEPRYVSNVPRHY